MMNSSIMEESVMNGSGSSKSNGGHPSNGNPVHLSYRYDPVTGVIDNMEERSCPTPTDDDDDDDDDADADLELEEVELEEVEKPLSIIRRHETDVGFFHIDGPSESTKLIPVTIEGFTYAKVDEKTLRESKSLDVENSSTKMLVDELPRLEHMDIAPIEDERNWKPCCCYSNSCTRTIVLRVINKGVLGLVFLPSTVTISQVMERVAEKLGLTLNTFQLKVIDFTTRPCCRSLVTFLVAYV